jgi:uncharacterized protein (TIGR02118 family)
MISYFVRYRGSASDPAGFIDYYAHRHAPILERLPGITSLVLHTPVPAADPFPVRDGSTLLLAQMRFRDVEALTTALQSAARSDARADFHRFPPFQGEVTHEAMSARVIF